MQRERARVFGDRSLKVRHAREPMPAGDTVHFPIPAAAPKPMIKPFDSGPRQPRVLAAHEIDHLSLEPAVITRAVKHCRAGGRIELAIETPQNFAYCVVAVTQIKEITKYLTTPAINGDCVAVNPAV